MNNIKAQWWKALGVCLICYTIIAGLLIPLKPGIVDVIPSTALVGQKVQLNIQTYNSQWDKVDFNSANHSASNAWLKLSPNFSIHADHINVKSRTELSIDFTVPNT